jgi:HK97 family phage major capsid protein
LTLDLRPKAGEVEERSTSVLIDGRKLHGVIPYGVESRDLGGFREVIEPGALNGANIDDLVATVDHAGVPIGRHPTTLAIEDRSDGLHWSVTPPESRADVREAVERGDLRTGSWRMVVAKDRWEGEVRHIEQIARLLDVSVVTTGAYPAAVVELRSKPESTKENEITKTGEQDDTQEKKDPAGTLRVEDRNENVATVERRDILRPDQSMREWGEARGLPGFTPESRALSFDRMIRGMVTGDWDGADTESRALSESPTTAGGHMVPTPVAATVIDKARAQARIFQSGAVTVPMTSSTLKYARLTAEATPGWRNEAAAITDQAMTFDSVTFTARSMAMLVKVSMELFDDAPNTNHVIENSFAKQIALELDRVGLRGSGTAPEPRGVLNQTGVTLTSHGANGAAISALKYDFLIDSLATLRALNFEPNAVIDAPRTEQGLSKLVDTTGQYITPPAALSGLTRLPTNQVPTNLTVGTSTDCSEVYTADWSNLLVGLRTGFTIKFLGERFIDNGQYAFMAYLRGDIQLAQPAAFVVDLGVRG